MKKHKASTISIAAFNMFDDLQLPTTKTQLKNRWVEFDPTYNTQTVFDFGIHDVVAGEKGGTSHIRSVSRWHDLILRCYSTEDQAKRSTYHGCNVQYEFQRYSSYLMWEHNEYNRIEECIANAKKANKAIDPRVIENLEVDKDMIALSMDQQGTILNPLSSIVRGSKSYGKHCMLLPKDVNNFMARRCGAIPGVAQCGQYFKSTVLDKNGRSNPRRYATANEAHLQYQHHQIAKIMELLSWNVDVNVIYRLYEIQKLVLTDITEGNITTFWQK